MNLAPAAKTEWTFAMISPQQNAAVVSWLEANSKRPMKAMRLWAHLFEVMRSDTGEILRSREELAEKIGMTPRHLSETMTELASINAILRKKGWPRRPLLHEPEHRHARPLVRAAQRGP